MMDLAGLESLAVIGKRKPLRQDVVYIRICLMSCFIVKITDLAAIVNVEEGKKSEISEIFPVLLRISALVAQ